MENDYTCKDWRTFSTQKSFYKNQINKYHGKINALLAPLRN